MRKKVFAMLLTAALCVGMLPTSVLAEGEQSDEDVDTGEIVEMSAEDEEEQDGSDASVNETVETEDNKAVTTQVEPQTAKKTEESDAEDESNEPKEYKYEGNTVNVTASLPADSEVPSDAELKVTSVDEENEDYDDLIENADDAITDGIIREILFYDISLYSSDGDYLKVEDKATVTIEFKKDAFSGEGSTHVLHFDSKNDNKAKDISGVNKKENDDGDVKAVNFDTEGFSVFAVADVMPLAEGDADLYITYAGIDLGASGTSPFDATEGDGNDISPTNDIIRSFDRATYDMDLDIDSKSSSSETVPLVRIHFEVSMQGSDIENEFYTQGFSWADHYELTNTDTKHTITGYYDYKHDEGVAGGEIQGISMAVQVLAMADGMILQPTGKVWLEELDADGNPTNALSDKVDLTFPALEISAKLQLNVYLYQGGTNVTSVEGTFDFASGVDSGYINYDKGTSIYGRMYGYGIALEMYNTTTGKGMKGQALPDGDTINLSVNLNSTFKAADDYGGGTLDLSTYDDGNYQLLFYALEGNTQSNSTCADGRSLISEEGDHPTQYHCNHVPYNKATSAQLGVTGVEDGGNWKATGQTVAEGGTTINISVDSYKITQLLFPYAYPDNSSANAFYTKGTAVEDIDCAVFSAGELWVIQPYSYVDSNGDTHDLSLEAGKGTFTIQVKDGVVNGTPGTFVKGSYDSYDQNVHRNADGKITAPLADENGDINYGTKAVRTVDTQVYNSDDSRSQTAEINPPGNFANEIKYRKTTSTSAFTNVQGVTEAAGSGTGTSYATLGYNDVSVCGGFSYTPNTRSNIPAAANILIKFDASALSIWDNNWLSFPRYDGFSNNPEDYNIFFGYLESGENWESDTAMQEADEDDIAWYGSRQSGKLCIAVLFEYRLPGSTTGLTRPRPSIAMDVLTDSSLSGNVYMTTEVTRLWTVSDIAEIYNEANGTNITYSDVIDDTDGTQFIKPSIPSVTGYTSTNDLPMPSYGYGSGYNYNTPLKGSVYQKKQYNEDGTITGHNGGDYYGDSLLILDYTSDVNIKIAQKATDQQDSTKTVDKSIYNFDNTERIADLEVTGSMDIQNSEVVESWGDTITTITVTVPEGASYISNSAQYGTADTDGNFTITYTPSSTQGQEGTVSDGIAFTETTSKDVYEAWLANESATGGMVYISTDEDGNQVLTFSVKGVPIQGTDVVRIYFRVELGNESNPEKDLTNNASLTFDATIRTTEDKDRALSGANGNEDTTTILITRTGSNTFSKYSASELVDELNEQLEWTITWDNTSQTASSEIELLDDMPDKKENYSEDYPYASDYHGTYAITGFQIDLSQITAEDAQKLVVYYTMDSAYEGDELVLEHDGDESKLDITWEEIEKNWEKLEVGADGSVDFSSVYEYEYDSAGNITGVKNHVYAWAIGGTVPAGEGVHITLTVTQYGGQGADYMTNVAYDSTGNSVFHRSSTIYRVLRSISGTVWLDEDMDGGIDTGVYNSEQRIGAVRVQLQIWDDDDDEWKDAKDVYGENFEIITDVNGDYEFTNLGAGTYRVLFSDNTAGGADQNYLLSEHSLTEYEASGILGAYNSKAKAYEPNSIWPFAAGDYQGVISSIDLPALEDMTVYDYIYEVPYQNAGYTKPQQLDVTKTWIDADGNKVTSGNGTKEITVDVTANTSQSTTWRATLNEDNNWTNKISNLYYYDGNGQPIKYSLNNLEVTENGVPNKYELAKTEVSQNDDGSYVVTLENDEVTTEISGKKTWEDNDDQDGYRPEFITIRLWADGVEVESKKVTEADDWAWEFTNLSKYNDDGTEIQYTVTEDAIDHYTTEYDGDDIINRHTKDQTSVTVVKIWDDKDDQDGIQPQSITVELLADGDSTGKTLTLDESNNWVGTFTELDMNHDHGTKIEYTVEEVDVPEGYEVEILGDATTGYRITNSHEPETIDISGEKTWDDSDDKDKVRPESITINLYADGEKALDKDGNAITATVTASDGWKWSFTDLPKYRDHGEEIVYTITEDPVDDYLTEIDGLNVVNKLIDPKLSKEVAEDDYERKEESGEHMHDGEDTSGDGWGTWDDADNNQEVTYHLKVTDIEGVANLTVHDYLEDGMDFEPDTVEVRLNDGGTETTLSEGTNYTMTQGNCSDPDCQMEGCTFEVKFSNDLFTDVSSDAYLVITYKALTDTHEADYDDYEDDILNYSYMTYGVSTTSLRRSAVISTETDLFGFGIYKYADEFGEEVALAGAEFVLEREGEYATFEIETDEDTEEAYYMVTGWVEDKDSATTLTSDADGMIRIEGLDDDTYKINETKAPVGYEIVDETITVIVDEDGVVTADGDTGSKEAVIGHVVDVENTLTLTEVKGSKTWDDKNNQDGKRPDKIVIHLLANGDEVDSKTVTETDDWKWSFEDLRKYQDGAEIVYTITEEEVDGYTSVVDGYDVTNFYTPGKVGLNVQKIWDDKDDQDGIRPDEITVKLLKNGEETGSTKTLDKSNEWSASFTDLDEYTDGEKNEYSVEEISVEGYTDTVTSIDDTTSFIITNTHTPKEETPGTGGPGTGGNGGNGPKTGDTNNIGLWLALLVAAMAAALVALRLKKRS